MSIAEGLNKQIADLVAKGKIKETLNLMNKVKNNPTAYIDVCKVFVSACVKNGKIKDAYDLVQSHAKKDEKLYASLSNVLVDVCIENQVDISEVAQVIANEDVSAAFVDTPIGNMDLLFDLAHYEPLAAKLVANSYYQGIPLSDHFEGNEQGLRYLVDAGLKEDKCNDPTAIINNFYIENEKLNSDGIENEGEKFREHKNKCLEILTKSLDPTSKGFKLSQSELKGLPLFYQTLYKVAFDENGNIQTKNTEIVTRFIKNRIGAIESSGDQIDYEELPAILRNDVDFILAGAGRVHNRVNWLTGLVQEVLESNDPDKIKKCAEWFKDNGLVENGSIANALARIYSIDVDGSASPSRKEFKEFVGLIDNTINPKEPESNEKGSKQRPPSVETNGASEEFLYILLDLKPLRIKEGENRIDYYQKVLETSPHMTNGDLCTVKRGDKTILHCLIDLKEPRLITAYFGRVKSFKGPNLDRAKSGLAGNGRAVLDYLASQIEKQKDENENDYEYAKNKEKLLEILKIIKENFTDLGINVADPQKSASAFEYLHGASMAEFLSVDNYAQKFGDLEENYLHQAARTNRADVINVYGKLYPDLFEETNKLGQKPLEIAVLNNQNLITIAALAKYTKRDSMHQIVSKRNAELTGDVKTYLEFLCKFDEKGVFTGTQEEFDAIAKNKKFIPYLTDWLTTRFEGKTIEDVKVAQPKRTEKKGKNPSGKPKEEKGSKKAKKNSQANLGQHLGQASEGQVALADNTDSQKTSRVAPFNKLGERLS